MGQAKAGASAALSLARSLHAPVQPYGDVCAEAGPRIAPRQCRIEAAGMELLKADRAPTCQLLDSHSVFLVTATSITAAEAHKS
jgi:hypothetical protein